MVIIMEPGASPEEIRAVEQAIEDRGCRAHRSLGEEQAVVGVVGAKAKELDPRDLEVLPGVREVHRVMRPYILVDRTCRPSGTVVDVAGVRIGGDNMVVIAGPCAVESREQIQHAAAAVRAAGAQILRGGAYRPRSSPYTFQGLGEEGLRYLREAADSQGMPCVTEVMDPADVDLVARHADMLQVGARSMQNFRLLAALGACSRPVLLKRGLAATLEELLLSAEHIVAGGNPKVILCERGVRTFEPQTRFTLDLSAIPVLQRLTHLPIIVDPSHATGLREVVSPMARAAVAAGADGVMLEVHPEPDQARCHGGQSLSLGDFRDLMGDLRIICPAVRRRPPRPAPTLPRRLSQPLFARAAIIGVGLIGGSMALALRESGAVGVLVALDRQEALDGIRAAIPAEEVYPLDDLAQGLAGADLVVLAMPVKAILDILPLLGPHLKPGALVTDVGSTKAAICQAAMSLPEANVFVGGHPMAGSERLGAANADALLFQDAAWALCYTSDTPQEPLAHLKKAIRAMGAHPLPVDPLRHDRLAAAVSHVPRLVAAALANSVGRLGQEDPLALRLAAGGFRDVTRTASSPHEIWHDILDTNQESIRERLGAFHQALDQLRASLGQEAPLRAELAEAARYRLSMPQDLPGLHRPEREMVVRLLDEPGALAAVTTALAKEGINIRDIQVLKVRQNEDGVLRLAFEDQETTQRAAEVLRSAGHNVRLRKDTP